MKLGIAAIAVSAFAFVAPAVAAEEIVIAHGAGIAGNAVEELIKEFEKDTGIKAVGVTMSDTDYGARIQLAARTGTADFDVALTVAKDVVLLAREKNIFAPIDTSLWEPATLEGMKKADLIADDYAVSHMATTMLVYGPKLRENPPTSYADLFNLDKWPGNRGFSTGGLGVPVNLEYALVADGVPPDQLYPLDIDRAIKKLKSISDNIVLWDNAPKGVQDIVNGDTSMSWIWAPAALAALGSGQDVSVVVPDGTAVASQIGVIMKSGPNSVDAAQKFFAWWYQPERQARFAKLGNWGLIVPSKPVLDLIPVEDQKYMPFAGAHPEYFHNIDYAFYVQRDASGESNLSKALEAWNEFRTH